MKTIKSKIVIVVVLLGAMSMLVSCGSSNEVKDIDENDSKSSESAVKIMVFDEAIDAMEKGCKEGNKQYVLDAYEFMLRFTFDYYINSLKEGKNPDEEQLVTKEQEERANAIPENCHCVTEAEFKASTEKIQKEYEQKMDDFLNDLLKINGKGKE